MSESKYAAQQKYNRKNFVRFPLDLKPDVLNAFKEVCAANDTTPTTEIKRFIAEYTKKYEIDTPARISATLTASPHSVQNDMKEGFNMPISDQFSGLDMKELIGSPLSKSAEASVTLAKSTEEFIEKSIPFREHCQERQTNKALSQQLEYAKEPPEE